MTVEGEWPTDPDVLRELIERQRMNATCSQCGASWHDLHDTNHQTLVCLRCGHLMPAEGTPDDPGSVEKVDP